MMTDYNELFNESMESLKKLSKETPQHMECFQNFMGAFRSSKALDSKTTELIAIGLSVASLCEWCIAIHVKKAIEAGAKRNEILEAAWVAVLMKGGPALMYMQHVLKALDDFNCK
ncbi:MAG: carboxymuconolactone decarboxylase family protein [Candidatus Aenigmatarchaeota archaeon]